MGLPAKLNMKHLEPGRQAGNSGNPPQQAAHVHVLALSFTRYVTWGLLPYLQASREDSMKSAQHANVIKIQLCEKYTPKNR